MQTYLDIMHKHLGVDATGGDEPRTRAEAHRIHAVLVPREYTQALAGVAVP